MIALGFLLGFVLGGFSLVVNPSGFKDVLAVALIIFLFDLLLHCATTEEEK